MKKQWQEPRLETLHVSETKLGKGWKIQDWTYIGGELDLDLTNNPEPGSNTGPIPNEYMQS